MKKILLSFLLAFAFTIFIPTSQTLAADVPDFRQVAGNYVTNGERVNSRKGYRIYGYNCPINLNENFAEQYIYLLGQYGIVCIGHTANDFRRSSAQYIDKWFFNCRGLPMEVWRYKYFNEGRTSFSIRISNGLSYAGY